MTPRPEGERNREAVKILRGLKDRIDRVEQAISETGIPNLARTVRDRATSSDTVSTTVTEGGTWEWDSTATADQWDGSDTWG